MSMHVRDRDIIAALELKEDGTADAADIVTKALNDLQGTLDERFKSIETKAASFEKLTDRLDKIEIKLNRPGVERKADGEGDIKLERKAVATFARSDDDTELKSMSVSSDPDGGYVVLPALSTGM